MKKASLHCASCPYCCSSKLHELGEECSEVNNSSTGVRLTDTMHVGITACVRYTLCFCCHQIMVLFIGFFDITIVLFSMFALQNRVYFHLIAVAGSSSNAVTDLLKVLLRKNTLLIARDYYCSPRANKLKKPMEGFQ